MDVCMVVGFGLTLLGFVTVFVIMGRQGGLAMGFASYRNMGAFFRDPSRAAEKKVFTVGVVLCLIGSCTTMGGVMVKDARERRACKAMCVAQGHETGLVRGDPHVERPAETPRMCWCQTGDRWSDAPAGPPPVVD